MDDKCTSGTQMRCQLKKIQSHWFLEVGENLHRLSVLNEAICVHMEDNVIFADDLMYQVKVKDSNEVNIIKIEDLCDKTDRVNTQQSNEQPEVETNDSVNNISADSDDLGDIIEYFDETLEFGQGEYTSEDDEKDADLQLQLGSEEVTGETAIIKTTTVTALFDFKAKRDDELSFKAGDGLLTTSPINCSGNSIWIKATHKISAQTGFIPRSYVTEDFKSVYMNDWWHNLSRQETECMLMSSHIKYGTFVIRDSSDKKSLVMSVKFFKTREGSAQIIHYKIMEERGEFFIADNRRFADISNLIQYYKNKFRVERGFSWNLGEPLDKKAPNVPFRNLELQSTSLTFSYVLCTDMHTGNLGNKSVIIKQYKQDMINDFKREIDILTHLQHKNVINVLAVYTKEEPFLMFTDMMKLGTLCTYLRRDKGKRIQMSDILDMTIQIAEGMAYLVDKNVVHRDVRAENILVCHGNRVKIAGFHLARWLRNGVYYFLPDEKFPVKWSAIEVHNKNMCTELSDVWSFGVLLYELITFGGTPFPGKSNLETVDMINQGYRMEKPTEPWPCPQECYDIMLKCWDQNPSNRPTFLCLVVLFKQHALSENKTESLTGQRDMKDINEGEKKKGKKECAIM